VAAFGLASLITVLAATPGASGQAGSDRGIAKLRQQPCPELALTREKTYSDREVALALRGRFFVAGDRVKLKPKVNWFKNHRSSREFQEQLHSLRWMDVLFQAYREGDRRAILDARRLAVDWVEQNPLRERKLALDKGKGGGKGRGGGKGGGKGHGKPRPKPVPAMAWQNLVAGYRASYLGYVTRAASCEGMLPKGPARTLLKSVKEHGQYLATGDGYFQSNHGLFTDLGLFLLADRYFPFVAPAGKWEAIARDRFPRTLAGRTSNSGFWLEHSADYHFLAIRMAETFLNYAGEDPRIRSTLDRLEDAAPWFIEPDGRYPLIGDSSADRAPVEYRKVANTLNGYRTFLDAGAFVVSRSKRYFATTAGFHNASHKQSDELGFELFDRDTRVVTGPGKYGFDRDERRAYVLSNAAHSVVTIDKQPWPRDGSAAYGSGLIASGAGDHGWFAVLGRNPLTERQGVSHSRLFVYHPFVGLFVFDTLDSRSGKHEYRRYLQFGEDLTVRRENKRGLELGTKSRKREFDGCVRDEASPEVGSNLRIDRGKEHPLEGYTFPRTGKGIPRWTATWRSKATDVSHLLGIGLQRGCPFSVRRVPSAGLLDFVLTREGHKTVQVSVSQAGTDLFVTETEVEEPLPPIPPVPPADPVYGESPSG
jgi:hypothetical protein